MRYRIIVLWLFCVVAFPLAAQEYQARLPYRVVGGKMLVEMILNGTPRSFFFDTGGRTALTDVLCEELGLPVVDSMTVTDANSNKAVYPVVSIASLLTPDKRINFRNVPAMKLQRHIPFECFGADGLIGSDLLVHMIVEIDGDSKTITLTSAEKVSTISLRKMLPFVRPRMPVILVQAGAGNNITCLFDTGCSGFLLLRKADFEALEAVDSFTVLSEGYGESSIGVGGMGDNDISHRLQFPLLSLGPTKFKNVVVETSSPPYTLLGVKLLDYGKVTLDYPRARFYFEARETENDLAGKQYKFSLRVKDGDLVVSTVWGETRELMQVGDKVTRINGKPTRKYDFCESIISGIPELREKKECKLTILTNQGEREFVYQKE